MRLWVRMLSAGICLLLLGGVAQAETLTVSVRRADGAGEAVSVWKHDSSGKNYLFLPAYMKDQALTVSAPKGDLLLDGTPLPDGSQTDAIRGGGTLSYRPKGGSLQSVAVLQGENLPAIHLTTASGSLDYIHKRKGNKEAGTLMIVLPDGSVDFAGSLDYVKGHGNATFVYDKKSYQIKLEEKSALLGMDSGKRYVLLANQHENSLLRNRITLELARELGLAFTPDCRSVDLYVNGEYRGNYLLTDKVTIASNSVDVEESEDALEEANKALIDRGYEPERYGKNGYEAGTYKGARWPVEPADVTGGFLFELEYQTRYGEEASGVVTERGQAVVVKEPEQMSLEQGAYANELLNRFERAIFSEDGVDAVSGQHYAQIADLPSLARKYLIEELSKNYDATKSSQYFYKDSDAVDPLLYAGPVWDYDSAWGNYAHSDPDDAGPEGLIAESGERYAWWPALYRQRDFAAQVRKIYQEEARPLLLGLIGDAPMPEGSRMGTLDELAAELDGSAAMNFLRWRVFNHSTRAVKTGADYAENIEYLRGWIRGRLAWLDGQWLGER